MKSSVVNTELTKTADIHWRDNTPHSAFFDDFYFSSANGIEETEYVFLERNYLAKRWAALPDIERKDTTGAAFTIGETGFGTGLNFLCAWRLWDQYQFRHNQLHFISVEKFPVSRNDLIKTYKHWPTLTLYCEELLANYPLITPGIKTISLAGGNVRLSLIFDDALTAYQQLESPVDAWFLDGFTPSRNPDMWSAELFSEVARLSHSGTTFATFSAAGIVRKGLQAAGFNVLKYPGLGLKREMCFGEFKRSDSCKQ